MCFASYIDWIDMIKPLPGPRLNIKTVFPGMGIPMLNIRRSQHLISSVVDIHAPLKQWYLRSNQVPYMNGQQRKAIYQRNMWRNKDKRNPIATAQYVHCRNNVVKITKSSVNTYFRKSAKIIMAVASSSLKLSSHFWVTNPIVSVEIKYYWMKTEE